MMATASVGSEDALTQQFISQLLENDLLVLESARRAEQLQLSQALAMSREGARAAACVWEQDVQEQTTVDADDAHLALQLSLSEARSSADAEYAQAMQASLNAQYTVDRQYALKVAATERKTADDAEFAAKLQAMFDSATPVNEKADLDSLFVPKKQADPPPSYDDALASTRSKGKGRRLPEDDDQMQVDESYSGDVPFATCGICMDPLQVTHSPLHASLTAQASNRVPFGMCLPCPQGHKYCLSCLTSYIRKKLDPDGVGVGKSLAPVFPIRCPECREAEWPDGIPDDVAQRIFDEEGMAVWYYQKLLESTQRFYCPNPHCSTILEVEEDSERPQAVCPSCHKLLCSSCRTIWHSNLTCEEYQALPLDERMPEDLQVLQLAEVKAWRRCPNCAVIVEHISGCNHITCRCGFHFCFRCGSACNKKGMCTRQPPCALWDEERLLDERERVRNPLPPAEHPQIIPARAPDGPLDLEWMNDETVLNTRHWFTSNMVGSLQCGYCLRLLPAFADLRYHLAHTETHSVYTCCGRFFRRRIDFDRHCYSRIMYHYNQGSREID